MKNECKRTRKFDYSWVIVGLSMLMLCVTLGFCSSSKSLYLDAITNALGIERGAFSLNDTCRFVATAVVNLFFGTLVARFGAKKLILAGFVCLIVSMSLYSVATNIYVFYIGGTLLGVGLAWTSTAVVGHVVNKWCRKNQGAIMGAVLASNGIGAAIAAQVFSPIIDGSPFGYRTSYRIIVAVLVVSAILILMFFKNEPKDRIEDSDGLVKKKKRGQNWVGIEFSEAVRKKYFYAAAICIFFVGMVLQGMLGIAKAHMTDTGISPSFAANVITVNSLSLVCFKFLTGVIYDKFGLRITSNICTLTASAVLFILSQVTNSETGMFLAMVYGIFSAIALPLETIMIPIYAGDFFGQKSYSKHLGIFSAINSAGLAAGSPFFNAIRDYTGSYVVPLCASSVMMIVVVVCMQFVISAANRERRAAERL